MDARREVDARREGGRTEGGWVRGYSRVAREHPAPQWQGRKSIRPCSKPYYSHLLLDLTY